MESKVEEIVGVLETPKPVVKKARVTRKKKEVKLEVS